MPLHTVVSEVYFVQTETETRRAMGLTTTVDIDPLMPERIAVWSDYRLKEQTKAVPGAKWSPEHRRWTVPLSWPSCLALRAEFGSDLKIEPALREWATEQRDVKVELIALRTTLEPSRGSPEFDIIYGLGVAKKPGFLPMFAYQHVGAYLIEQAGDYLLTDETGTGKSRTALAGLARLTYSGEDVFPMLIVAPKSMLYTWRDEVVNFFPLEHPRVVTGTPAKVRKALEPGGRVYIVSYDLLRRYTRLAPFPTVKLTEDEKREKELNALGIKAVIMDEIHRCKAPTSKQTRAFWYVAQAAKFRVGLTGTPLQDTPEDLWSVLHGLMPGEYQTKTSFVDRYLDQRLNMWGAREIRGVRPSYRDEFFANLDARMR